MRAWNQRFGEIPEGLELDEICANVGYIVENGNTRTVYVLNDVEQEMLLEIIDGAFNTGARLVSYQELFDRNDDFFKDMKLWSCEMLKAALRAYFRQYDYYEDYLARKGDKSSVLDVILDAFGEEATLSTKEIKKRAGYLSSKLIEDVCAAEKGVFASLPDDVWLRADLIEFADNDVKRTKAIFDAEIQAQGYSNLTKAIVKETAELYPMVPESVLRKMLVYDRLAEFYAHKHNTITRVGDSLSAMAKLRQRLSNLERATINEIRSLFVKYLNRDELTDVMKVAYKTMLRVSRDEFVRLDAIDFDVEATDDVIATFSRERIIPTRSVDSFTAFPPLKDYVWNPFLLDAYCRNKSKRFRAFGSPNSERIIGGICPTNRKCKEEDDMLAEVVVENGLKLSEEELNAFFVKQGYKKQRCQLKNVIRKAQIIILSRERDDV